MSTLTSMHVDQHAGSSGYHHLLSPEDEALLPLLRDFQRIIMYRSSSSSVHSAGCTVECRRVAHSCSYYCPVATFHIKSRWDLYVSL
eukprot:scaffold66282_cov23-Tisochrysis_lutea.AAC.1